MSLYIFYLSIILFKYIHTYYPIQYKNFLNLSWTNQALSYIFYTESI